MQAILDKPITYGWLSYISTTPSSYFQNIEDISYTQSISSEINKVLLYLISQEVEIEDSYEIEGFLKNNYGLVKYLYEVQSEIYKYFEESRLKLGLFSDPDDVLNEPEIYIEIETYLSPKEANQKLNSINKEWLFASGSEDLTKLNLTLKFI